MLQVVPELCLKDLYCSIQCNQKGVQPRSCAGAEMKRELGRDHSKPILLDSPHGEAGANRDHVSILSTASLKVGPSVGLKKDGPTEVRMLW